MTVVGAAGLGNDELPGRALDQPRIQAFLEQGQASTQSGFGNAQRSPGRGQAAVVDDLDKVVEIIEITHAYRSIHGTLKQNIMVYRAGWSCNSIFSMTCAHGGRSREEI